MMDKLHDLMAGELSNEQRTEMKNAIVQSVDRIDCRVRKFGRWFEVVISARMFSETETSFRFFCKTLRVDAAWLIYIENEVGYHGFRNDDGGVREGVFTSRPSDLSVEFDS